MFGGGSVVPTVQVRQAARARLTGTVRNPATPELPTIAELYPGYEALIWHGLFVAGRHAAADRRPAAHRAASVLGAARVQGSGSPTPARASPTSSRRRSSPPASRRDYEKYGKLIRSIGVKVE